MQRVVDEEHKRPRIIGYAYDNPKGYRSGRASIYDHEYVSPTMLTAQGGGNKVFIVVNDNE